MRFPSSPVNKITPPIAPRMLESLPKPYSPLAVQQELTEIRTLNCKTTLCNSIYRLLLVASFLNFSLAFLPGIALTSIV